MSLYKVEEVMTLEGEAWRSHVSVVEAFEDVGASAINSK